MCVYARFHLSSLTHAVLCLLVVNNRRHLRPVFGNLMKYTFCLSALSGSTHFHYTITKHDICSCDAKHVSSRNTKYHQCSLWHCLPIRHCCHCFYHILCPFSFSQPISLMYFQTQPFFTAFSLSTIYVSTSDGQRFTSCYQHWQTLTACRPWGWFFIFLFFYSPKTSLMRCLYTHI